MRLLVFCSIIITLAAIAANGQSSGDQEREAICKKVACREATIVKLKVSDKEYAEFEFPKGPYVADGFINVLSGEHFSVEFDEREGKLLNPRFVREAIHPERTVSVELSQTGDGTLLQVSNPFSKTIVYECMIQHVQQKTLRSTDVLSVHAGLTSYEAWPYPVPQVIISGVHYQSSGSGISTGNTQSEAKARILSKPDPELPKEVSLEPETTIVLRAIFTKEGEVTNVQFVKSIPKDIPKEILAIFKERAIEAAKRIKFIPAMKDGRPVSMWAQLEYNFTPIEEKEKPASKTPEAETSKEKDPKPKV